MKEGYKKTELGEIPNEWNIVKTDEILINDKSSIKIGPFGSQLKKEFLIEQGYKVYGQENVFKNDFTLGNRYINKERYEILKSSELKSGDLVISMMGTVGKTAIVPEDIEIGIMDSHLIRLRVDESKYSKELLRQMIQNSPLIKKQIKKLSVGGIMEGLSSTIIKQLKFPLINLKEQEKIAEILSTVDGQIDDTEMLIEKCQELKKGLMQRLLTKGIGHTEFKKTEVGEIPVEWEVVPFESLYEEKIRDFGSFSTTKLIEYVEEGVPYLRSENFRENKLNYETVNKITKKVDELLNKSYVYIDNILFTKIGNIGAAYCYKGELGERCNSNATIAKIKLNREKVVNEYIVYFLISDICKKQYAGDIVSTPPRINMGVISKFRVTVPPIEEQEKISQILISLDKEIEDYKNKKQKLEELKKGLMQQLLTGKLRTIM
ncbi:restriction endonuclease subunit S [Paraclostridium sordellii]|uniref:restriction endonuclease subunit S n=1 Tax=Paraclostridium sordellii TaxID=1505 RepID=UPI001897311D|nr:restriction endonuclease subunit S [Paeniclostridium sordellii]